MLTVDPSLLYLLGDPEDPRAVWTKLEEQFQRKTWANKLHLRRKLFSMKLREGESVNEHIKAKTVIFEAPAVISDAVTEEDRVVHLLASLPESYNALVTALEAQSENVPKWEVVTEWLLHQELKLQEKAPASSGNDRQRALAASSKRFSKPNSKGPKCHFCHSFGHIKKDCPKYQIWLTKKQEATPAETRQATSDEDVLIIIHALTTTCKNHCIVDSGATCHMSNHETVFFDMKPLTTPQEVTVGDGHSLQGTAVGAVNVETLHVARWKHQ